MLKTIKAKIIFITVIMLLILSVLAAFLACESYYNNKANRNENAAVTVAYFSEKVNGIIKHLEGNSKDLAIMGTVFYNSGIRKREIINFAVKRNFEENRTTIGGGVWFEPFKIKSESERFCVYAFDNGKDVIIDPDFESVHYDYFNQMWYKTIKKGAISGEKTVLTSPYYDETGTNSLMITIGSGIFDKSGKFVGMSTVDWQLDEILKEISTLKPTENSFALFADKRNDYIIALTNSKEDIVGKSLKTIPWYNKKIKNGSSFTYENEKYISFFQNLDDGLVIIVNIPADELYGDLNRRVTLMALLILITILLIAGVTYYVLTKNVNNPISYLSMMANKIGHGDLNAKMEISEPHEFAELASSFNRMTSDMQNYITNINMITAEKQRIESELSIAKSIQLSTLPNVFPPYPEHKEFEIFASMETAKEVGGDFYDFFFIDPEHFAFLIADVSGKGVPAALFMMTTKTLIKNIAKTRLPLDEMMTKVNRKICKTNEQGFFVTLFLCVLELSTGKVSYVNAGHNPPLLKKSNGEFYYFKTQPNLVLGAMNDMQYKSFEEKLEAGDFIFLYTDGITEALNYKQEFYGEKRLLATVNKQTKPTVENILATVKEDVNTFANGAQQADDITMLALQYKGDSSMAQTEQIEAEKEILSKTKTFLLPAAPERFKNVLEWLEKLCDEENMKNSYRVKLTIAVEEIFANISTYAYPPKEGDVEISFKSNKSADKNEIEMQFADSGTPYNPLEKQDPDITLKIEDRPVGGLGIFIVKNSMDFMDYKFEDGRNILTIKMQYKKNDN